MADGSHFSPIAFQCERGEVIASVPSPDDPQVDDFIYAGVALRSGKRTGHYRAKVVHGDLDAPFFEFKTTLRDPVIQAFRTTGRISVRDDPELVARTKSERKLIERFFAACRQTSH